MFDAAPSARIRTPERKCRSSGFVMSMMPRATAARRSFQSAAGQNIRRSLRREILGAGNQSIPRGIAGTANPNASAAETLKPGISPTSVPSPKTLLPLAARRCRGPRRHPSGAPLALRRQLRKPRRPRNPAAHRREENEMLKRENESLRSLAQGGGELAVPRELHRPRRKGIRPAVSLQSGGSPHRQRGTARPRGRRHRKPLRPHPASMTARRPTA
jgi:hypothetical protein